MPLLGAEELLLGAPGKACRKPEASVVVAACFAWSTVSDEAFLNPLLSRGCISCFLHPRHPTQYCTGCGLP